MTQRITHQAAGLFLAVAMTALTWSGLQGLAAAEVDGPLLAQSPVPSQTVVVIGHRAGQPGGAS